MQEETCCRMPRRLLHDARPRAPLPAPAYSVRHAWGFEMIGLSSLIWFGDWRDMRIRSRIAHVCDMRAPTCVRIFVHPNPIRVQGPAVASWCMHARSHYAKKRSVQRKRSGTTFSLGWWWNHADTDHNYHKRESQQRTGQGVQSLQGEDASCAKGTTG